MVVSDLQHIEHQIAMTPALRAALAFLRRPDVRSLPDGKTVIDGERIFALVQRYETIQTAIPKFEYHRAYLDVQYIAEGEEVIGWAPAERMQISEAYDEARDIAFGSAAAGTWTPVLVRAGQAAVLYPEDGHAPKLAANAPAPVMKIVIKVAR